MTWADHLKEIEECLRKALGEVKSEEREACAKLVEGEAAALKEKFPAISESSIMAMRIDLCVRLASKIRNRRGEE